MSGLPEERLGQLRVAKLRALVGVDAGEVASSGPLGDGAALLTTAGATSVLIESAGPRSLGGALVWAIRKGATSVTVVVDTDAAVAARLAREATWFALPIEVRRIEGTTSVAVTPAPFDAAPTVLEVPPEIEALVAEAAASSGIDLVVRVEHGVPRVELRGLEIARVVQSPDGAGSDGVAGGPVLEVGVGRFDREIAAMMFSNVPTAEALEKAATMVAEYRQPGATIHPLRDLVPERWLRELVIADPASVGAVALDAVDTTLPIDRLRDAQPAAAVGTDVDGNPLVVVCTAGIDLDVVPLAGDTRAAVAPDAGLVICGPARNLVEPIRAVGERLLRPARFVPVELPY